MLETTYYFSKFSVEGTLTTVSDFDPSLTRDDRVKQSLIDYTSSTGPVTVSRSGEWYFGATQEYLDMLFGKFGKVYTDEPTTYDESKGDFVDEGGAYQDAAYSMFFIHFPKNLLIYNSRRRVGHKQFIRNFSKGYGEEMGADISIEIDLLYNTDEFEKIIEEYPVLQANFTLEPSNPHGDPDWETLDDHIKEMLAQKLGIDIESMEGESLNFEDDMLAQIARMGKSEYGDYELVYNDQGHIKLQSSDKTEPVQMEREQVRTLEEFREMASSLMDYATSFLDE